MTSEELREIITHPEVHKYFEGMIKKYIDTMVLPIVRSKKAVPPMKESRIIPEGWITYDQAAEKYPITNTTVRSLIHSGVLHGGRGIVLESSLVDYYAKNPNRGRIMHKEGDPVPSGKLSYQMAADFLDCTKARVHNMVHKGTLAAKNGLIDISSVREFMERKENKK